LAEKTKPKSAGQKLKPTFQKCTTKVQCLPQQQKDHNH